jgi:hypothetical protein
MKLYTCDTRCGAANCGLRKKENVVTLRMNEDYFNMVEDYAEGKGLTISAYINSIIDQYTCWFIPLSSHEKVTIPKRALLQLLSYTTSLIYYYCPSYLW